MGEFGFRAHFFSAFHITVFTVIILHNCCQVESKSVDSCPLEFKCGYISQVSFPFSNKLHPDCGLLILDCDAKPSPTLNVGKYRYKVLQMGNDFTAFFDPLLNKYIQNRSCETFSRNLAFLNTPLISSHVFGVNTATVFRCNHSLENNRHFSEYESYHGCKNFTLFYPKDGSNIVGSKLPIDCSPIQLPFKRGFNTSNEDLFEKLTAKFDLSWNVSESCLDCHYKGGRCLVDTSNNFQCSKGKNKQKMIEIAVASVVGVAMLMTLLLCLWRNFLYQISMSFLKTEDERNIEVFLRNNGSFSPKRYTYLEVKRITNSFRNKLGQGGYGFVYKGKLANGNFVAVKLLKELNGSGEEFINEVASISRTSHVNIVTLLGFCVEGDRRALLYEFMPNGSLESFIYDGKLRSDRQLEWLTLYKITIGIARGLEYLHRGCRTKILHFDIKPHNILLDEDFCPKISDFGLAKLHTTKESFVSITGARGTIGYVAPEVACRNFGAVSHKADVYSYGMMVLEIVSGRKNVEHDVDRNSEIYFPHWIYRQIELDKELGLKGIMNELDKEYARKMIMVGLWCIHVDPSIRPSISMVLEMLESRVDLLPFPPKPYLYSSTPTEANSSTLH